MATVKSIKGQIITRTAEGKKATTSISGVLETADKSNVCKALKAINSLMENEAEEYLTQTIEPVTE